MKHTQEGSEFFWFKACGMLKDCHDSLLYTSLPLPDPVSPQEISGLDSCFLLVSGWCLNSVLI